LRKCANCLHESQFGNNDAYGLKLKSTAFVPAVLIPSNIEDVEEPLARKAVNDAVELGALRLGRNKDKEIDRLYKLIGLLFFLFFFFFFFFFLPSFFLFFLYSHESTQTSQVE
jgi:hypothetical protein